MKNIVVAGLAVVLVLTGCTSANKAVSTPDDVYYSPGPKMEKRVEDSYASNAANNDDDYLRMKVRNRYQWDAIDDYAYWNDSRYDFGYTCFPSRSVMMNPYTPYGAWSWGLYYNPWGSFYNPCYTVVYYSNPKAYYGNTSKTNLSAFNNNRYYSNMATKYSSGLFKSLFNPGNSSSFSSGNNTPSRSFNSGSTISNSAGGRSGGFNSTRSSGSISRPSRP